MTCSVWGSAGLRTTTHAEVFLALGSPPRMALQPIPRRLLSQNIYVKQTHMGRLKKEITRSARIGLRITENQKTLWQEAADQEDLTLSKWIAKTCDQFMSPVHTQSDPVRVM